MGFDLKINGESIQQFDDMDAALVDHLLVNESVRIPVTGNAADISVRVVPKSSLDYDVLARARAEDREEIEKAIADRITPQDNPVAVALAAEFGDQPVGTIEPTDSEIRETEIASGDRFNKDDDDNSGVGDLSTGSDNDAVASDADGEGSLLEEANAQDSSDGPVGADELQNFAFEDNRES